MKASAVDPARIAMLLAGTMALAAVAWLVSRVWLGLDFSDEMQYYGQIASLTRTGRFFEDDLFLQQLGYFFLLPFFKLHAWLFPDLDFLVLFGRLLLLAAYGATGALFWHAATRAGGFSTAPKLAGLAIFFAWVPFQIFAFSYNTTAYLIIVALLSVRLAPDPARGLRQVLTVAVLLTVLTFTHPPAGLGLILVAVLDFAVRQGRRSALLLLGATAGLGLGVLGLMTGLHGTSFPTDLLDAVKFSSAFNVAGPIRTPSNLLGLLILITTVLLFVVRWRYGSTLLYALGAATPPALRWTAGALLVTATVFVVYPLFSLWNAQRAMIVCLWLLMILATARPGPEASPKLRHGLGACLLIGLVGLLLYGLRWGTGDYATLVFIGLLAVLAASNGRMDSTTPSWLATTGLVGGAVFAATSSNGLFSFGVGAAAAIPFLALFVARAVGATGPAVVALLAGLVLANGVRHPYLEQAITEPFHALKNVPAFRGIHTAAVKVEAIERLQTAEGGPTGLRDKRILVVGPQPWIYFALGGQPRTSMLFMHYFGTDAAYVQVAAQLFRHGSPDVIVLTNISMPQPIAAQVAAWVTAGSNVQTLTLPPEFRLRYQRLTGYPVSPQIFVITRQPAVPK